MKEQLGNVETIRLLQQEILDMHKVNRPQLQRMACPVGAY